MPLPLLDGEPGRRHRLFLMRIDVEHHVVGAGGDGCDQRAFDHLVRCVFEQEAVLEGSGLVLVAVADDVLVCAGTCCGSRPLAVRGKTRAAHTAQTSLLDDPDDAFRIIQRCGNTCAAPLRNPPVQVCADKDIRVEQHLVSLVHGRISALVMTALA